MSSIALQWRGATLVLAAAAFLAGCTEETPVGPDRDMASAQFAAEGVAPASAAPDLGVCENLQPPAGSKVVFHTYAQGVQIYHWNGSGWVFDGPSAVLSADPNGKGRVGIHYAGPTWESNSGSKVVGAVLERCTPDANAIPWLLLGAVSTEGPGIFARVAFIQRVNTVGGNAPGDPGSFAGQEARVPYTTEYYFYRAR